MFTYIYHIELLADELYIYTCISSLIQMTVHRILVLMVDHAQTK